MKLGFEETQTPYRSGSQKARVWTESWVAEQLYCPSCGNSNVSQFAANSPLADFFCSTCREQFELKSQKTKFGRKVADGAYHAKKARLLSDDSPNLLLLNYDLSNRSVTDICVVPKHFFTISIIEERKPLGPDAKRAGWIGSNILLSQIPTSGKIYFVRDRAALPKETVLAKWQQMLFLRHQKIAARGWLLQVLKCIDSLGKVEFSINDVYAFEGELSRIYPQNRHVKPKIRQQLQVLRDNGYLEFIGNGQYRLRPQP